MGKDWVTRTPQGEEVHVRKRPEVWDVWLGGSIIGYVVFDTPRGGYLGRLVDPLALGDRDLGAFGDLADAACGVIAAWSVWGRPEQRERSLEAAKKARDPGF